MACHVPRLVHIAPIATPLLPTVRGIHADGDMVIILFDAAATTKDGQPCRNTYT
jgi:uncharacterized protein